MDLYVVESATGVGELGDYVMTTEQFAMKEYHPFLATQKWDRAFIEINNKLPMGLLSQLINAYRIVPILKSLDIDLRTMKLLCEILPEKAVEMRSLFYGNRDEYKRYITVLSQREGWKVNG